MTDTNTTKAYNLSITPASIEDGTTVKGTRKLKATVTYTKGDKTMTRTFLAFGKAADEVAPVLEVGKPSNVVAIFEHIVGEDGKRGAEYLKGLGLPKARAAA